MSRLCCVGVAESARPSSRDAVTATQDYTASRRQSLLTPRGTLTPTESRAPSRPDGVGIVAFVTHTTPKGRPRLTLSGSGACHYVPSFRGAHEAI